MSTGPTCNFNVAELQSMEKPATIKLCGRPATHRAANLRKALFCTECATWVRDLGLEVCKMTRTTLAKTR